MEQTGEYENYTKPELLEMIQTCEKRILLFNNILQRTIVKCDWSDNLLAMKRVYRENGWPFGDHIETGYCRECYVKAEKAIL